MLLSFQINKHWQSCNINHFSRYKFLKTLNEFDATFRHYEKEAIFELRWPKKCNKKKHPDIVLRVCCFVLAPSQSHSQSL